MKDRIRKLARDDFIRHTGIMVVGTGLVNGFNLLYHLAAVRLLPVAEYGVLNALISITFIFSQFGATCRPALTKFLAAHLARGAAGRARALLKRAAGDLGLLAVALLALFVLCRGPLAANQQIGNPLYMGMVGPLVALSLMAVLPSAFLWSAQRFAALAGLGAAAAFLKLAMGVGLILAGFGVGGAMVGYTAFPLFMLLGGLGLLRLTGGWRGGEGPPDAGVSMAPVYGYLVPTGITLFAFAVLTHSDVILVKKFFPPLEAGYYSVAQMAGKILLYLPGAVSVVVFPKAAAAQALERASGRLLKKGLLVTLLFGGAGTLVCALLPATVLRLLTGKTDPESVALVPPFALAMSLYALTWLAVYYNLSIHNTRFIGPIVLLALGQVAVISLHHPHLLSVVRTLCVFGFLSAAASLLLSKPKPQPTPSAAEDSPA